MEKTDIQITTSIRHDLSLLRCVSNNVNIKGKKDLPSTLYLFLYHRDRLLAAAQEFAWPAITTKLAREEGATFLQTAIRTHLLEKYEDQRYQDPLRVIMP